MVCYINSVKSMKSKRVFERSVKDFLNTFFDDWVEKFEGCLRSHEIEQG